MSTGNRIYLAHSPKDKRFAARLARDLRARGRDVWFAGWAVLVMQSGWSRILELAEDQSWLGIVLSPDANLLPWLGREPRPALLADMAERGISRVLVLEGDCVVPSCQEHIRAVDFRAGHDSGLEALLSCVDATLPLPERSAPLSISPRLAEEGRGREREYFEYLLRQCGGDINQAARVAGMEHDTFHQALRRAGADPLKFRL